MDTAESSAVAAAAVAAAAASDGRRSAGGAGCRAGCGSTLTTMAADVEGDVDILEVGENRASGVAAIGETVATAIDGEWWRAVLAADAATVVAENC